MAINCANLSQKELDKLAKDIKKHLAKLNINVGDLKNAELIAAVSKYQTDESLSDAELYLDSKVRILSVYIANARNKAKEERQAIENNQIGSAEVVVLQEDSYIKKSEPSDGRHSDVLYIYGENLQAYNFDHPDSPVKAAGLASVPDVNKLMNVSGSSAALRTNSNGERNKNTLGLVTKKNAQDEKGHWNTDGKGVFEDTEEDFFAFTAANTAVIKEIKERLEQEGGPYRKVVFMRNYALEKAGLPKRFAEALQNMLEKELGISSQVLKSDFGKDLYGLEIQNKGIKKSESTRSKPKSKKERAAEQAKKDAEEAIESLKEERPLLEKDSVEKTELKILPHIYPDINVRRARSSYLATSFSDGISRYLEQAIQFLQSIPESERTVEQSEQLDGLLRGTDAERRAYLLSEFPGFTSEIIDDLVRDMLLVHLIHKSVAKDSISEKEISDLTKYLANAGTPQQTIDNLIEQLVAGLDEDTALNLVFESGSYIGSEFDQYSIDHAIIDRKDLKKARLNALRYLGNEFGIILHTPGVFQELLKEASGTIEFNENIRLVVSDVSFTEATDLDIQNEEDDFEESAENRTGLGLVKYKLLNPATTLSIRMKTLLAGLHKKNQGNYMYNDLYQRIKINPTFAYYVLLNHFSKMNRAEDFEEALKEAFEKYPWLSEVKERLEQDDDLKREFYTTFRKVFIPYGIITDSGNIQRLNQKADRESLIQEVTRIYEGRQPLSTYSVFDDSGQCVEENVKRLHSLLTKPKKFKGTLEELRKAHPFAYVKQVLGNTQKESVAEDLKMLSLLRGELDPKYSIEELLHTIGIPTDNLDIDSLIPYVTEDMLQAQADELGTTVLEVLKSQYLTREVRDNIYNILSAADQISAQGENNTRGFKDDDHLIDKFKGSYYKISDALQIATEAYDQASFRGVGGNTRFSYAAPDMISELVGIISQAKTAEEARQYIEEEWGQYNFFKENGQWYNWFLERLFEDEETRKQLSYLSILGFDSKKTNENSVAKVPNETFRNGLIYAFFSAASIGVGEDTKYFGYFKNPLYSDVDALHLIKLPRFGGTPEQIKSGVVDVLVNVLKQEISRIRFVENLDERESVIEFYNDERGNGRKFNYFPSLNARRDEILSTIASFSDADSDITVDEIEEVTQNYLRGIILDIIDGEIDETTGQRRGGELQEFLDKFDDEEAVNILNKIAKIEKNRDDENNDNEDTSTNTLTNVDVWEENTPEEQKEQVSEQKKREAYDKLTEFWLNDFFGHILISQIISGDLAYFKNYDDLVKRAKESYACGEKIYALDKDGNPLTEKCIYLEDSVSIANSYEQVSKLLDADNPNLGEWEKSIYRGAIAAFQKITETDGQSLRTLESFRKIFTAAGGKWTDSMEVAYNNIQSGKFTAADFQALWNPTKPFLVSHETLDMQMVDGTTRREKVGVQHKNSEYLISALFSVIRSATASSPVLRGLQQYMKEHNVDVAHFHSVVKHGFHDPFDINYDRVHFREAFQKNDGEFIIGKTVEGAPKKVKVSSLKDYLKKIKNALIKGEISQKEYNALNERFFFKTQEDVYKALTGQGAMFDEEGRILGEDSRMFKTIPLKDLMFVQPSGDHLLDQVAIFGSQLRNIIPADLPSNFTMTIKIGGKEQKLNREEAVKYYNTLIVDQLLDSFSKLNKKFSNIKALKAAIDEVIRNNPKYGDDVKAALELNEDGTAFKMPFNSPNLSNKIEELLLSMFKNNIQRQKINGGSTVLVSNFGYSNKLQIKYKNDDPTQGIEYIPAYMPAYMRSMYKDFLISHTDPATGQTYWELDYEKLKANADPEVLELIGYRIPTEDKYSIMPIRIMGFMPVIAGTTITLPSEIITMSGTDFDIDKLFLMIRNLIREVAPRRLGNDFIQWFRDEQKRKAKNEEAVNDLIDSILKYTGTEVDENEDTVDDEKKRKQALNKLFSKRDGFSEEDLEYFKENIPEFEQFLELYGHDYIRDTPYYRVKRTTPVLNEDGSINLDETSKLESVRDFKERKQIRDNMLIDTIWSIMTTPEASKLSLIPGSYPNVKISSRQQWIMHDKDALKAFIDKKCNGDYSKLWDELNKLDDKELEKFYEEYASPKNPFTIDAYVTKHRNLMDGRDLIGIFAVNSSNHYKLQFLNSEKTDSEGHYLASENVILREAFYVTDPNGKFIRIEIVSPVNSPITKVRVGRICAEFQAASPDNGKDPCLGDLGASPSTAYIVNFLANMGFTPQMIGMLNTMEDILETSKSLGDEETSGDFDGDMAKIVELTAKVRLGEELDTGEKEILRKIGKWYKQNIESNAKDFQEISKISRSDSPNGAIAIKASDAVQQILKQEDFIKFAKGAECGIIGMDRLIDIALDPTNPNISNEELRELLIGSPIPRLQAFYSLGIKSVMSLCGQYLPQMRPVIFNALKYLRSQMGVKLTYTRDIPTIRQFFNHLNMYLLTSDSIFATDNEEGGKTIMEKRNYYIHDFPIKLRKFLDAKTAKGKYKYPEIRNSTIIQRISNVSRKGIKFANIGKVSTEARRVYFETLDGMIASENPEVREMAQDLLMYSFYDNGLNFAHNSFGIFFTTFFLSKIPRYIDALKAANGRLESDPTFIRRFVEQFLLNNPGLVSQVPTKISPHERTVEKEGGITEEFIDFSAKQSGWLYTEYNNLKTYIKYKGAIYQLQENPTEEDNRPTRTITYKKVTNNKTGYKANGGHWNYTPFYDATQDASEIDWEALKNRGAVATDDAIKKLEEAQKKAQEKSDKDSPKDTEEPSKEVTEKETKEPGNVPSESNEPTAINIKDDAETAPVDEEVGNSVAANLEASERENLEYIEEPEEKIVRRAKYISDLDEVSERFPTEPEEPNAKKLKDYKDTEDSNNRMCPPRG